MSLLSRRFQAHRALPRLIIIGAGFAGLAAARRLAGEKVHVTVIDSQPQAEWLPNLHELVSRQKTPAQLQVDRQNLLANWKQDFLCTEVTRIDRQQQRVHTASGSWHDYDMLILASGSRAHDHGIEGVREHALLARSVEHCQRIGNALTRLVALPGDRSVVLAGGGIEGLEILGEILRRFGDGNRLALHLVEPASRFFPRFPGLHERLCSQMQGQVQLHLGRQVTAVAADHVRLDDGSRLSSRLTLWSAGRRSHALPVDAGLSDPNGDAPVMTTLQSIHDPSILIAGDTASLPRPLAKQAYHAQDMGRHAAENVLREFTGKAMQPFKALQRPVLLSFGDRDGVMFHGDQALASPGLIALKEGIYRYGFQQWQKRKLSRGLLRFASELGEGMRELDAWQLLLKSTDSRVFRASASE